MTVQDMGRIGFVDAGLSRGGAADRLALAEGAALLGQAPDMPAIEMMALGGEFEVDKDCRIALTGAPMRAQIDGRAVVWNASHFLPAGARLTIGAADKGTYGYLHFGGGLSNPICLGARSTHLAAGIGQILAVGDQLPLGDDTGTQVGDYLDQEDRFSGGLVRVLPSFQTALFSENEIARFQSEPLTRDARANRMGVKLNPLGDGFHVENAKNLVSESVIAGDIQITGDGTPFVLMAECQTTGGYPRIATVLPCDLPRVAQAPAGAPLQFCFVEIEEAVALEQEAATQTAALSRRIKPLIRDPRNMTDLLSYNLISGMVAGDEFD